MSLFEDTSLFSSRKAGRTVFDVPDAEVTLYEGFFTKEEADHYYNTLLLQTPWAELEMDLYDKKVVVPRMVAWYEDKSNPGADPSGHDWTPHLLEIRDRVEKSTGIAFNSVLLNLYRDGNDGVSWHSDREHRIGKNPVIASVTFGETRLFKMRHKVRKDVPQLKIPLHHGALLLMGGTTNTFWQHEVPKSARKVLPRINLTFRIAKR